MIASDDSGGPTDGTVGRERTAARERILEAAYDLFATHGVAQVGVDRIIARSGCAKASLYAQFGSKDGLAIAFLDRREALWTRGWLEAAVADDRPAGDRLLAIFDLFDGWFRTEGFEGCSFITVLLETERTSPVNRSAADHLARIRGILCRLADEAGLEDPGRFAHVWHILMKGSIVAATEGHTEAARDARAAGELVLAGWPRRAP